MEVCFVMKLNNIVSLGSFMDFSDGTIKNVFKKNDNDMIEVTLINNKSDIDVFCVPSHHFCNLGCTMCHLTNKMLKNEMIQIDSNDLTEAIFKTAYKKCAERVLNQAGEFTNSNGVAISEKRSSNHKCLISFMGVGEPLLNLKLIEQMYSSENYLKEIMGYNLIGYALSTMMPNDNLNKLSEIVCYHKIPLKVHFSLHSPFSDERFKLLPSTSMNVEEALQLLVKYRNSIISNNEIIENISQFHEISDPVEIHYTLIDGINDSDKHLNEIIRLLKLYNLPIKFINFNPIGSLKRSNRLDYWLQFIKKELPNIRAVSYTPPGREVGSSCGEFTKHYYHSKIETKEEFDEFELWRQKHLIKE